MTNYQLDPDYRKTPDTTKPYCIRCQKPIQDTDAAVRVTPVNDFQVTLGGDYLIGQDCWKQIQKERG